MAKTPMTPGVYIVEKNAFPGSAVGVETAIPAFIGYTEIAVSGKKNLVNIPTRITSFSEYVQHFGKGFSLKFKIEKSGVADADTFNLNGVTHKLVANKNDLFYLYNSIRLFYANGGGTCYIISLNTYGDKTAGLVRNETDFVNALEALKKEFEPTLVLMPDAVVIDTAYSNIYTAVLKHCAEMQSRFGIFDLFQQANTKGFSSHIADFRTAIGNDFLNYGAAYFPWLNTTIVDAAEVDFENIDLGDIRDLLAYLPEPEARAVMNDANKNYADLISVLHYRHVPATAEEKSNIGKIKKDFHQSLLMASTSYKTIINQVLFQMNQLPAGGAIAGIYTVVDNSRGVWKAPANVNVSMATSPVINITPGQQENLNIDAASGKSINVIRSFPGLGTMIWGARTLDGNSQDWRYINVRRTIIMIEQSAKLAVRAYVFEPNDANTWVTVKSMLMNFLFNLWKQGALAGASPEQAFDVSIGLGSTMTAQDILEGLMLITVKVAVVRPAEFIIITFRQQMQQS